ncbi:MAG: hypothetical protein WBV82_26010 [Myxococcaceae bacterium]
MLPVSFSSQVRKAAQLVDSCQSRGGTIIRYDWVLSALVLSVRMPRYCWVAPGRSRIAAGLPWAGLTFVLGWWSITGLFWNLATLLHNLRGGTDVTALFMPTASPEEQQAALARLEREQKSHQLVFAAAVLLILAASIAAVWPVMRKAGWF